MFTVTTRYTLQLFEPGVTSDLILTFVDKSNKNRKESASCRNYHRDWFSQASQWKQV